MALRPLRTHSKYTALSVAMPGGSAAAAAAEALDQLMAKAEECRAAALKYAMAPFRKRAEEGEDSGERPVADVCTDGRLRGAEGERGDDEDAEHRAVRRSHGSVHETTRTRCQAELDEMPSAEPRGVSVLGWQGQARHCLSLGES